MVGSIMCAGLLAALVAKRATGKGTFLSSSLLGSAVWYNGSAVLSTQYGNQFPVEADKPQNPLSHQYQCKDGEWLMVAVLDYAAGYPVICKLLNREDLIGDERFSTIVEARKNVSEFLPIIKEAFLKKNRDEWIDIMTEANVVCGKIGHLCDLYNDPQVIANDFVKPVEFESGNTIVMPTVPLYFSEYSARGCNPTGRIGRDTDEILLDVGMDENEIAELRKRGAIK
jgi:crotonobetainyl-CoA:carnitine CoA-transferase CaiB-like acyl-CoA transferase